MARFDLAGSGLTDDRGYIAARAELGSLIIAPLIAADTALGVLVVFRDVTEEPYDKTDLELCADLAERGAQAIYNAQLMADVKRADAERAAAQDRLRHAERLESLGQLVGGIAHDFNNLLNVIAGFADVLAEEIAGLTGEDARPGNVAGDVEQVRGAAQRAIRLTRQLLIFARSDVVHPEVLSLNDIIAGLDQLLRRTLGEHITLTITPADGLWPVKADAGQLEQVLVNLAVNARDAPLRACSNLSVAIVWQPTSCVNGHVPQAVRPILARTELDHVQRPPRRDSRSLLFGDLGRASGPGDRTERTQQAARIFDAAESGAAANDGRSVTRSGLGAGASHPT